MVDLPRDGRVSIFPAITKPTFGSLERGSARNFERAFDSGFQASQPVQVAVYPVVYGSSSLRHRAGNKMQMNDRLETSRRKFLEIGAMVASSSFLHSSHSVQAVDTLSNERLEIAVIGTGERGKYLIANLPAAFRVTALCDCSLEQIESVKKPPARFEGLLSKFVESDLKSCRIYQDYRRMLEVQKFDAVIISTADHHHALAAILAMQAGANVYIEKPLAVTIGEGRAIVKAAKKYRRVVQVGSQQRSMQVNRTACEFIRSGGLGRVTLVEERNFPGPMPYIEASYREEDVFRPVSIGIFFAVPLRCDSTTRNCGSKMPSISAI